VPLKVLIVDDDPMFRHLFRMVLSRIPGLHDAVSVTAEDGAEAVTTARDECPDVVLMDVMLPRLDGFQATRLIKEMCPAAKIVLLTSIIDKEYERAASSAGADAFVYKQDTSTLLASTVQRLISRVNPDQP
jgi:DNA-binding NarL/FixJ family response regulator